MTFTRGGRPYRVADTAGLRRHAGARGAEERLAADDALGAIRFCEVAILVLDAGEAFEQQDRRLARLVEEEGRALVIAVNKWDLVENPEDRLPDLQEKLAHLLPTFAGAPMMPLSALKGTNLDALLNGVVGAHTIWSRRTPTGVLNRWLVDEVARHPPRVVGRGRIHIRYLVQTNTGPPTFALFTSRPGDLEKAWQRYLINGLRRQFDMPGVPVRLMLRGADNPYRKNKK